MELVVNSKNSNFYHWGPSGWSNIHKLNTLITRPLIHKKKKKKRLCKNNVHKDIKNRQQNYFMDGPFFPIHFIHSTIENKALKN